MNFEKPLHWSEMVKICQSFESYRAIVRKMFADGVINEGRIFVLEVYTRDVIERCDSDTKAMIWREFVEMYSKLNGRSHQYIKQVKTTPFLLNISHQLLKLCSLIQYPSTS